MSSTNHITSSILPASVTPEWLAKTYSEYLFACADDQIELNNAINDLSLDDTLESLIDAKREVWDDNIDVINNVIAEYALQAGCTCEDIEQRTEKYLNVVYDFTIPTEILPNIREFSTTFNFLSIHDCWEAIKTTQLSCDELTSQCTDVQNRIEALASELLTDRKLSADYKYPLTEGFVSLKDLAKNLILYTNFDIADGTFTLPAVGSKDISVGNITFNAATVIDQLKDNAASSIAWAQGFASCSIENLTDRITNFTQNVQSSFSAAYTQAKESFNNVRAVLSQKVMDVKTFVVQAEELLGWKALIDSNSVLAGTDVSQYTGASPYSGMDLHTAKGLATAVVTTVAAAGYATWQLIKKGATKLWGKLRPYVKAITTDPEDLKVVDKDALSYQIDNWCYNADDEHWNSFDIPYSTEDERDVAYNVMRENVGKVTSFDNYFSSLVLKIVQVDKFYVYDPDNPTYYLTCRYSFQFKPKCINFRKANECGLLYIDPDLGSNTRLCYPDPLCFGPSTFLDNMNAFVESEEMYLSDDSSEEEFALGFQCGTMLTYGLAIAQLVEFGDQVSNTDSDYSDTAGIFHGWTGTIRIPRGYSESVANFDTTDVLDLMAHAALLYVQRLGNNGNLFVTNPTNKTFLKIASGYKESTDTYAQGYGPYWYDSGFMMYHGGPDGYGHEYNVSIDIIAGLLGSFWALQQIDRHYHPGKFLFLPYTSETWTFDKPHYEIKTDEANRNIADIFISAVTIIVVIAITIIIGAKIARTIKKAKFKKWTTIKGRLDNAIWQGQTLSKKDWRKYLRADRKLSKMNLWSAGTAASSVISSADPTSYLSSLIPQTNDSVPITTDKYNDVSLREIKGLIRAFRV